MKISNMTQKEKEQKLKEVLKKINSGNFTIEDILDEVQLKKEYTRQKAKQYIEDLKTKELPIM